jgi:hypothetical protein
VPLVGIDWADQEHVYCLMDEAGTTLSTGTIEHTAEGHPLPDTLWQFAFSSMHHCPWARAYRCPVTGGGPEGQASVTAAGRTRLS